MKKFQYLFTLFFTLTAFGHNVQPIQPIIPTTILTEKAFQDALNILTNPPEDRRYTTQEQEDFILYIKTLPEKEQKYDAVLHHKIQCLLLTVTKSNSEDFFLNETIKNIKCQLKYRIDPPEEKVLKKLLKKLRQRKIIMDQSFCDLLVNIPDLSFKSFCINADIFFTGLRSKDTKCLAGMLHKNKRNIRDFSLRGMRELYQIANLHTIDCFSSMYHGHGFPYLDDIDKILDWSQWKNGDDHFNKELFQSFATSHHGKGTPTISDLEKFEFIYFNIEPTLKYIEGDLHITLNENQKTQLKDFCKILEMKNIYIENSFYELLLLLVNPQDIDMFFKKVTVFFSYLTPLIQTTIPLKTMLHTQEHIINFISRHDHEISRVASHDLLQSFSFMYDGHGFPYLNDINKILEWPQWKKGNGHFNKKLFQSFATFHQSKGIPTISDLEQYESIYFNIEPMFKYIETCIRVTLNENQKTQLKDFCKTLKRNNIYIDKSFYNLLRQVKPQDIGSFFTKAIVFFTYLMPSINTTTPLTRMLCSQKHIIDFISRTDVEISYIAGLDLLSYISHMCCKKGFPNREKVEFLLSTPALYMNDRNFNQELFKLFSFIYTGQGLPNRADILYILSFRQWYTNDKFDIHKFKSFATWYQGKGRPSTKDIETFFLITVNFHVE